MPQIRFFYHLYGIHIGDLTVRVVEENPRFGRENNSILDIWRETRNMGDNWYRAVVTLPPIKNWYDNLIVSRSTIFIKRIFLKLLTL